MIYRIIFFIEERVLDTGITRVRSQLDILLDIFGLREIPVNPPSSLFGDEQMNQKK